MPIFPLRQLVMKLSFFISRGLDAHCLLLEIIASLWRENPSRDQKTELLLELCSRSEMLS